MSESSAEQTKQQLREAYGQIKAGQNDAARALLSAAIRSDTENAESWWLMALIAHTSAEKRDALQKVLRLKPDHIGAREMLDALKIQTLTVAPTRPEYQRPYLLDDGELPVQFEPERRKKKRSARRWPFVIALLILAGVFAILGFILAYNAQMDIAAGRVKATQLAIQQAQVKVPDILPADTTRMPGLDQTWQHGTLKSLEQQVWSYVSPLAEKVIIRVHALGDNFAPLIGLYNEHGKLIAHPTDRTGSDKTLIFQLPMAGTYSVLVSNLGGVSGDYTITLVPDMTQPTVQGP